MAAPAEGQRPRAGRGHHLAAIAGAAPELGPRDGGGILERSPDSARGWPGASSQPLQQPICLPSGAPAPRLCSCFLPRCSPEAPVTMVKEKGNYKYRSQLHWRCRAGPPNERRSVESQADMFWVWESVLWSRGLHRAETYFIKNLSFSLRESQEHSYFWSVFAQPSSQGCVSFDCYCIWNFWLCLRLVFLPSS